MKRIRWRIVGYLTLLILALVLLLQLSNKSMQALMPVMLDLEFVGEYSIEGKEWKEWDEDTRLSSFEGELWLRGHFTEPFFDDMIINFYLEHIGLTVLVDGQVVYETGRARETLPEMVCGSYWSAWGCKGLGEQEEVEFHIFLKRVAYSVFQFLHFLNFQVIYPIFLIFIYSLTIFLKLSIIILLYMLKFVY